jgi:hypothetical protein
MSQHYQPRRTSIAWRKLFISVAETYKDRFLWEFFSHESNEFDEMFGIAIRHVHTDIVQLGNSVDNLP